MRFLGDISNAASYLSAAHRPAKTRWTKLPVRFGTLRLRLDYQPDEWAHTIHVRHDPRDTTVGRAARATYYGHVKVDSGYFVPHATQSRQVLGDVLTMLEAFVADPAGVMSGPTA